MAPDARREPRRIAVHIRKASNAATGVISSKPGWAGALPAVCFVAHSIRQSLLRGHAGFCIRLQVTAAPTASTQFEERLV
jgi:hypothetical protein